MYTYSQGVLSTIEQLLREAPHSGGGDDFLTLKIPFANTKLGRAAFAVSAPSDWNELQKSLKNINTAFVESI